MRLIDADVLKIPSEEMIAKMIIDSAPTIDAVSVVRCKECKHHGMSDCPVWDGMMTTEDYMWCYYGEREGE